MIVAASAWELAVRLQGDGVAMGRGRILEDHLGLAGIDDLVLGQRQQEQLADGERREPRCLRSVGHGMVLPRRESAESAAGTAGAHR